MIRKQIGTASESGLDLDRVGATASMLCAIHCALMPMVITLLPLVGLSFLASEKAEWTLLGLSASLGISSLCWGYREHRRKRALLYLASGLALLASGRIAEERGSVPWGVGLVVLGGVTVATSHLINRRLCKSCRVCQEQECDPLEHLQQEA